MFFALLLVPFVQFGQSESLNIREKLSLATFFFEMATSRIFWNLWRPTVTRIFEQFELKRCQKKHNEHGYEFPKSGSKK